MNVKKQAYSMKLIYTILAVVLLGSSYGCKEDDNQLTRIPAKVSDHAYVNTWISNTLQHYYLWSDQLPSKADTSLAPNDFFKSLVLQSDRFSIIHHNFEELLNSLQGVNKEAGYEIKLYRESEGGEALIGQIMYIRKGSLIEREKVDLMRGDIVSKINGQALTMSNYRTVFSNTDERHTITYSRFSPETNDWQDKGTITLNTEIFADNPNYMDTVYTLGDHKIGYYIYNFFATGPVLYNNQYNLEMDRIFADFKAKNITDLIIDLRYNGGGEEGATINLASLVGKNVSNNDIFTRREFNPRVQKEYAQTYGSGFFSRAFVNKTQNVGSMIPRVYILTSFRTASASELLINGLKPFMEVFLIGDVTVGKNVGMITFYERGNPRNDWGMLPLVVKMYNSLNQSDYTEGFTPDLLDLDRNKRIKPLGDSEEALLSLALAHITGNTNVQNGSKTETSSLKAIGFSTDLKRESYLLIDDEELQQSIQKAVDNF